MPRPKLVGEDNAEIDLRDVPVLIIRTEVGSFNEYDERMFPEVADELADVKEQAQKFFLEMERMKSYTQDTMIDFPVQWSVEAGARLGAMDVMLFRAKSLRRRLDACYGDIRELQTEYGVDTLIPFSTGESKLRQYLNALGEMTSLHAEMRILHSKLRTNGEAILAEIEAQLDDEQYDAYSEYRMETYDRIRKNLLRARRAEANKADADDEADRFDTGE